MGGAHVIQGAEPTFVFRLSRREVALPDGTVVRLTMTETWMLKLLLKHKGEMVSTLHLNALMPAAANPRREAPPHSAKVHLCNLRRKTRLPIVSVWGEGYMLELPQGSDACPICYRAYA